MRTINGEPVPNLKEWHAKHNKDHYRFIQEHLRTHDSYIAEGVFGAPVNAASDEL